jgi:hypothetical protein
MPKTTSKKVTKSSYKCAPSKPTNGSKSAPRTRALGKAPRSRKSTQIQKRQASDGEESEESDGEQPHPKKRSRHRADVGDSESVEEEPEVSIEEVSEGEDMENGDAENNDMENDEEPEAEVSSSTIRLRTQ